MQFFPLDKLLKYFLRMKVTFCFFTFNLFSVKFWNERRVRWKAMWIYYRITRDLITLLLLSLGLLKRNKNNKLNSFPLLSPTKPETYITREEFAKQKYSLKRVGSESYTSSDNESYVCLFKSTGWRKNVAPKSVSMGRIA